MIPVFVWVLTFCIVFALKFIQPIVSILTFVKGSLILATVSVYLFCLFVLILFNECIMTPFLYIDTACYDSCYFCYTKLIDYIIFMFLFKFVKAKTW